MVRPSIPKKLTRVRPPSPQISYDLQIGDTIELSELPFVPSLINDLERQTFESLPQWNTRRFVDVNADNFESVLRSIESCFAFSVNYALSENAGSSKLLVSLSLPSSEVFEPNPGAHQLQPLLELGAEMGQDCTGIREASSNQASESSKKKDEEE